MTNLQKIREACIKANSKIRDFEYGTELCKRHRIGYKEGQLECKDCIAATRPIHLADVLLAIEEKGTKLTFAIWVNENGVMKDIEREETCFWNLKDDNLENQSEPTKKLIARLL